jgi:hypothetical protein
MIYGFLSFGGYESRPTQHLSLVLHASAAES